MLLEIIQFLFEIYIFFLNISINKRDNRIEVNIKTVFTVSG